MKSYIIHMSASTARRANAETLQAALPEAELVEAVNGRDPAQVAHIKVHPGDLYHPAYPFPLTPPEIGVFESHRTCWRRLVDSGEDFAFVAEDDLAVDPERLSRALSLIAAYATPDMYIRLPVKPREKPGTLVAQDGEMRLILPKYVGLQCIAQVVGRVAAERLLYVTEEIDRPVDALLQLHWVTGQPIHALLPNGNREVANEIGGSTIQKKIREGKMVREAKRAWYRGQLKLHPQA